MYLLRLHTCMHTQHTHTPTYTYTQTHTKDYMKHSWRTHLWNWMSVSKLFPKQSCVCQLCACVCVCADTCTKVRFDATAATYQHHQYHEAVNKGNYKPTKDKLVLFSQTHAIRVLIYVLTYTWCVKYLFCYWLTHEWFEQWYSKYQQIQLHE